MSNRLISVLLFYIALPNLCWADLPITIEDLLTEGNEFRLEIGLYYANADRNNIDTRFDLVQTGTGSFILLLVDINEQR